MFSSDLTFLNVYEHTVLSNYNLSYEELSYNCSGCFSLLIWRLTDGKYVNNYMSFYKYIIEIH